MLRFVREAGLVILAVASSGMAAETNVRPVTDGLPASIYKYAALPDPVFGWKVISEKEIPGVGKVTELELTSQTWQSIVWKHVLMVYEPAKIDHAEHMLLFVTGGSHGRKPSEGDQLGQLQLAMLCRAPVATLHQVPNQPLFGDRVEDDLITETWLKYLETGDDTWPLLFPMVKSAVRAMDALQQFSVEKRERQVKSFVITGASKRGWTSWLTPVVDKRIIATAPIVIDVLNFPEQMKQQKETWGVYSEQIADYTSKGLVKEDGIPKGEREQALWAMMDPYTYRETLTLPKLMIVGTNDRYWIVNAMNIYWKDLVGPRYALHVPNAGHNLKGGQDKALATLAVFFRHAARGESMPQVEWQASQVAEGVKLDVRSKPAANSIHLWTATSDTQDFRESTWTSQKLDAKEGSAVGIAPVPAGKQLATFIEFRFDDDGTPFSLTTLVHRD